MNNISATVRRDIEMHIHGHVTYPASKGELITACAKMAEIPPAEKEWFLQVLPEGVYYSPAEVIDAIGWS